MALVITSRAFTHTGPIPIKYTCEAEDLSPPLEWSGVPDGTKSLALIADDPDAPDPAAPKRVYVHWVLHDVPPTTPGLDEGATRSRLPSGAKEGKNDGGSIGYMGPCPPIGRHRYFFKLHALDTTLGDLGTPTKADLEAAMRGHIIEQAELMGTYEGQHGPARRRK